MTILYMCTCSSMFNSTKRSVKDVLGDVKNLSMMAEHAHMMIIITHQMKLSLVLVCTILG